MSDERSEAKSLLSAAVQDSPGRVEHQLKDNAEMTPAISSEPAELMSGTPTSIVMRFVDELPTQPLLDLLAARGLVRDAVISAWLRPFHYFWRVHALSAPDLQTLQQLPDIVSVNADLPSGEHLTRSFLHGNAFTELPGPARNLITHGHAGAIIAVIDSGFDLDHPNLNYVDRSLHFNAPAFFSRQRRGAGLAGRTVPYDASRSIRVHGTGVAGAAAALRRNPREPTIEGVAAGFPIMPLKVSARPTSAEVAVSIHWAVEHGARVINMSFKVLGQPVLNAAIENAWRHDVVLCAAAGNHDRRSPDTRVDFPARHPNVIAVGATDRRDRRKRLDERTNTDWGSQYGEELDLVAPGTEVQTLDDRGELGLLPGNYLPLAYGTSVASPQVAGLAALLFGMQPQLTNQQVRDVIEGSCHKLPKYQFRQVRGRRWTWNKEVGYGLVNLSGAVAMLAGDHQPSEGRQQ